MPHDGGIGARCLTSNLVVVRTDLHTHSAGRDDRAACTHDPTNDDLVRVVRARTVRHPLASQPIAWKPLPRAARSPERPERQMMRPARAARHQLSSPLMQAVRRRVAAAARLGRRAVVEDGVRWPLTLAGFRTLEGAQLDLTCPVLGSPASVLLFFSRFHMAVARLRSVTEPRAAAKSMTILVGLNCLSTPYSDAA